MVTGINCAVEAGILYVKFLQGKIRGKLFFKKLAIKVVSLVVGTIGAAGGAAIGGIIGSCLGPIGTSFAAIVGGRAKIDGDPMMVALDLSIDAEFFYWVTRHKPARVLYPSSSAAYPVSKQTEDNTIQLAEHDIDFNNMGQPDMTYGWTKLTGEYLAHIAAKHYGIKITCIRPFSGYGEDQDLTYPIPSNPDHS